MTALLIHKTQIRDVDEILRMESHSDNVPFILPNSKEEHIRLIHDSNIDHLLLKSADHNLIGFVILAGLKDPNKNIEFRRIVIKEKGKGFGRVAIQKIKAYCFEKLNCHRLWLDVFENNDRARYLYQSEGFQEERKLGEPILINNKYQNLIIMAMLDSEYTTYHKTE